MNTLHVAAVQFRHRAGDKEGNLDGVHRLVERAAVQGVDLIAFPEMCVTGYWHVRRLDPRRSRRWPNRSPTARPPSSCSAGRPPPA